VSATASESPDRGQAEGGGLTHIDDLGRARMVDVTQKPLTRRVAVAKCTVLTEIGTAPALSASPHGMDVVEGARFAGIQAAKQTASLIPLCHPIRIDGVSVEIVVESNRFAVSARTEILERTGVEMEALTACAMAALTLVDALIDVDPAVSIEDLTLWHKSGGRSGDWERIGPEGRMAHREAQT
jgi:cyclic pyranopterin monophosphate synthase